jgi:hypothetical protein
MIGAVAAVFVVGGIVAALVVTLGGSNDNGDSTDGGATAGDCVGMIVPGFPPLPSSSDSSSCHALEELIGDFYTAGNVDVDGHLWTGTCSCSDELTGALATCRYDCWRCWPGREVCTLQTDTYRWQDSFSDVSEAITDFTYQCGRNDSVIFKYPSRVSGKTTCTLSLNGEDCQLCDTEFPSDGGFCNVMDCSNLEEGGYFDTCSGGYDFGNEETTPFLEFFGASFAGSGRVPLEFYPVCPGNVIPF